jgi:hypothetical protein
MLVRAQWNGAIRILRQTSIQKNPLGTMQSIEHTLRSLDKLADQEQERSARLGKILTDYQAQANKPFEHEARMKELFVRQAQLNAALDFDKNEK